MDTTGAGVADGEPLPRALDAAARAVAHAAAAVSWQTPQAVLLDAVRRLTELRARVDSLHLDLVRQIDERGVATVSPVATTPEGFLRTACLVDAGQARRDVAAARATAPGMTLEPFGNALARGEGSRAHLDVAVRCLDAIPESVSSRPGASGRIVEFLQQAATDAGPVAMKQTARQLLGRLVPEREDRFDPDAHQRRFLDLHTDDTGMVVGAFQLDAVTGASLRTALDHHGAPTVGADGEPDTRTARQRRADGLGHVCETALGVATPRRGERPRIVVHATMAQLAGTSAGLAFLENGDPLSTAATGRLACDAVIQRVVEGACAGPLDLGRASRLVTLAQRRALEARDTGCVIPGCGAQASWCDAHHLVPWSAGGPTDLDNLCLLCPGHHTAVHAGSWQVSVSDGELVVVPPRWVDPTRTPRPVRRHRVRRTVDDLDLALYLDRDGDLDRDSDADVVPVVAPTQDPPREPARPDPTSVPGPHVDRYSPVGSWLPSTDGACWSHGRTPRDRDVGSAHVDLSTGPLVLLMDAMLRDHAAAPP